jgi:hypothetical protein
MAFAPISTYFAPHGDGSIRGGFYEKDHGNFFEYSDAEAAEDPSPWPKYNMKVWLNQGKWRYAKVVKTRAYVVVDEAEDGTPIVEKWILKKNGEYNWK